jgi:hypothetical protein
MPWSFIVPAAVGLFAANKQAGAAKDAAATTAAATDQATQLQRDMFNKQTELQQPYQQAGVNALNKLQGLADYTMFGPEQFSRDPGYGFRLAEGQKALDRQAAARGGLISGGALKAAARYGQDMGSQEYQNAFNRYQTERSAMLNPLQSLANVGQTAANTMGQAGQTYGTNVGNALLNQGANAGNAVMAGAAARSSAYTGAGNQFGKYLGGGGNFGSSPTYGTNPMTQTGMTFGSGNTDWTQGGTWSP